MLFLERRVEDLKPEKESRAGETIIAGIRTTPFAGDEALTHGTE